MRGIGVWGGLALVAAACAALLPGGAVAAERFDDLLFFQAMDTEPGFSALWQFSRNAPARDQAAGDYLIDINETGTWNTLLRESWTAAGDASAIAPRPTLEVTADRTGALALTATDGGGLTARMERPTEPLFAPIIGATKVGVEFHRAGIERGEMRAQGWAIHEIATDDLTDARKVERLALWDGSGGAIYFTMRGDQTLIAARVDSAGSTAIASSSGCRWTNTSESPSGARYPSSWTLIVPDWKWQAALSAEGTPSVSSGRIVQQVAGTAVGARGQQRLQGISDLRLR